MMPNNIEGTHPFDQSDQADDNGAKNYIFHKITLIKDGIIPPLTLLSDTAWMMYVIRLLNLETMVNATAELSRTDEEKADLLLIKLREKF